MTTSTEFPSLRALGLLVWLAGKPEGFRFTADDVYEVFPEGRDACRDVVNELIDWDLVERARKRLKTGQWDNHCRLKISPWYDPEEAVALAGGSLRMWGLVHWAWHHGPAGGFSVREVTKAFTEGRAAVKTTIDEAHLRGHLVDLKGVWRVLPLLSQLGFTEGEDDLPETGNQPAESRS